MLTSRELPRDEWHRLEGFDLGVLCEFLPLNAVIVVVERDGDIVACSNATTGFKCHVEGTEILPHEQGNTSVARRLLSGLRGVVRQEGFTTVLTGAQTDHVRQILETAGATRVEMDLYEWPIVEDQ